MRRELSLQQRKRNRKEWANDSNDSECQNEIFQMAKQMVKERQDITGLNCIKGASGKVIVDDKGIKESWKEYTWRNCLPNEIPHSKNTPSPHQVSLSD